MNRYRAEVSMIRSSLRQIPPQHREKFVCGRVAQALHSGHRPHVKLSMISAAIEALELIGKE